MGIRCDQWIGLSNEARAWLKDNVNWVQTNQLWCPHCGKEVRCDTVMEAIASPKRVVYGMFDDEYRLGTWRLKSGKVVKEVLQAEPWSSGPCFFTCLELEDGTRIGKWSQYEIDNA